MYYHNTCSIDTWYGHMRILLSPVWCILDVNKCKSNGICQTVCQADKWLALTCIAHVEVLIYMTVYCVGNWCYTPPQTHESGSGDSSTKPTWKSFWTTTLRVLSLQTAPISQELYILDILDPVLRHGFSLAWWRRYGGWLPATARPPQILQSPLNQGRTTTPGNVHFMKVQ